MSSTLSTLALVLALVPSLRAGPLPQDVDLTELSIEDLMSLTVSSVSKKQESWLDSAAAVYVVTGEELRRSGATTLPEALRLVPGLHVAQIDTSKWAVSSRGFAGQFSNKLLVLIDGRSVYAPLFAGVFWEVQDTLLEDVDRIEVIRGPGATLWGANAVNGVINVLTKNARDTQGGLLALSSGQEERAVGGLRYGGRIGEQTWFRVFAKAFDRGPAPLGGIGGGARSADDWQMLRGGFRLDRQGAAGSLTISGELYGGDVGQNGTRLAFEPPFAVPVFDAIEVGGAHLLARWSRSTAAGDSSLQLYYDRSEYAGPIFDEDRDTFDLDFQHRRRFARRHDVVWGLGWRHSSDDIAATPETSFDPERDDQSLMSAFVQDEIRFAGDRIRLTVGSKLEHNDYTGLEVQPSVRLLWKPRPRHTLWGSVARAVRTPSRAENDVRRNLAVLPVPGGPLALLAPTGNRDVEAEVLLAYEVGYRLQPSAGLLVDLAAFYNDHRDLVTLEPGAPFLELDPMPPHLVVPLGVTNRQDGETLGLEASLLWEVTERWRLSAGYTLLEMSLALDASSGASSAQTLSLAEEGNNPRQQVFLRSSFDPARRWETDVTVQYVDALPDQDVPSYLRLEARLGWRPRKSLELSVVVQDALEDRHTEFGTNLISAAIRTEIERSVYGKLTWSF